MRRFTDLVETRKMDEREAKYVLILSSVGVSKNVIARKFNYKYMDVVNVLRGNSFSDITGILNKNISQEEMIVASRLLKQGHAYREVANFSGIDANKVRNVMGVLQHFGEI